jgi:hypothetical protein
MTHPNHQTNGASLEDCHTNFFALVSAPIVTSFVRDQPRRTTHESAFGVVPRVCRRSRPAGRPSTSTTNTPEGPESIGGCHASRAPFALADITFFRALP